MARIDDFVYTIEDDERVEDLDNERAVELNPEFTFGEADAAPAPDAGGWDFGGASEHKDDELDAILKRHGGLKADETDTDASKSEKSRRQSDKDADNEASGSDSGHATAEAEDDSEGSGAESSPESDHESDNDDFEDKSNSNETTQDPQESEFYDSGAPTAPIKSFTNMALSRPVQRGIGNIGYTEPTAIQSAVVPVALLGKDVVAGAQTGSGKTAAYMIPTLERLVYRPQRVASTRVVVLTPTRELAMQVHDVGRKLGAYIQGLRFGLAVGGLNLRQQEQDLKTRPDIVVATPGRFIDHVRNSPSFSVDTVEILVVDEADRMLEEGFEAELNEILTLIPSKRQTLLFSATMNNSVRDLVKLSLRKPARIMIDPPKQVASGLAQEFVRIRKSYESSRPAILVSLLRKLSARQRVIVFVTRKQTAHYLRVITGLLGIKVGELHGSLSQEQRMDSVTAFKNLQVPILVCTDLASRGLDIPKIEVVINYELPATYDVYLHRVGRTARAGRSGTAISLVGESTAERNVVKAAVQAANASTKTNKQKILGRNVDWKEIDGVGAEITALKDTIDEVLAEEKTAKEINMAERDITRAQNIALHKDEIAARPKRTWFEDKNDTASAKKSKKAPTSNHAKKRAEVGKQAWAYSKTKSDRSVSQKRGGNRVLQKGGARKARK